MFPLQLWDSILSTELVGWIERFVNSQMPPVSGRGSHRERFDSDENRGILRMMLGFFNTSSGTWQQYLRSTDRLGVFKRSNESRQVCEKRFYLFLHGFELSATSVHQLFEMASAGLRSVFRNPPSESGTSELALDESMLAWSRSKHKWVVYLPRKPKPLGIRVYILAQKLYRSGLPIVVHAFPDTFDGGCIGAPVCLTCHKLSNEYSQWRLSGLTRSDHQVD